MTLAAGNVASAPPIGGLSFVIAARNEQRTVGSVVQTCRATLLSNGWTGEVIVVSDGSIDATASVAYAAGASVIEQPQPQGKAQAMLAGARRARHSWVFFVDADLINFGQAHIVEMVKTAMRGSYLMVCGVFDYGPLATVVQRFPWSTGQRMLPTDVAISALNNARGYSGEVRINEHIGFAQGKTVSIVLRGLRQRTKRDKHGWLHGATRNLSMWRAIAVDASDCSRSAYLEYLRGICLRRGHRIKPLHPLTGTFTLRLILMGTYLLRVGVRRGGTDEPDRGGAAGLE